MTNFLQDRLVSNDPKYFLTRQLLTSETDYQEICSTCHRMLPKTRSEKYPKEGTLGWRRISLKINNYAQI